MIPLCSMVSLLIVHIFLKNDVIHLANYFVSCGYMERSDVFYVAIENNEDKIIVVTSDIISTWSDNWVKPIISLKIF